MPLTKHEIAKVSGGALSTMADFIAADLSVLPDHMFSFIFMWKFWTRSSEHLQVGFFDDMRLLDNGPCHPNPYSMARLWVWKSDKEDFDLFLRFQQEYSRRQEIPQNERPPNSGNDPAAAEPPPEEIVKEQQAAVRAAYLVDKERNRAEVEAKLAEMLNSLTDEEHAELQRLVKVERETAAKEAEKAVLDGAAQEEAQEEEHRQRMAAFNRENVEGKQKARQRKLDKAVRAEKRKRLGIENDEDDDVDDCDDDDSDEELDD